MCTDTNAQLNRSFCFDFEMYNTHIGQFEKKMQSCNKLLYLTNDISASSSFHL